MTNNKNKLVTLASIGQLVWDQYGEDRYIGGTAANVAVHIRQLGFTSILISAVGDDESGHALIKELRQRGVNTDYVQITPDFPTGIVEISTDNNGNPIYKCTNDVAFDHIVDHDKLIDLIAEIDIFCYEHMSLRNVRTRTTLRRLLSSNRTGWNVLDLNIRTQHTDSMMNELLNHADIVKINEHELRILKQHFETPDRSTDEFIAYLIQKYTLKVCAVTLGKNGCILYKEQQEKVVSQNHSKIKTIDTSGAGDAFTAALVSSLWLGFSVKKAGEFSNRYAALVAQQFGATPYLTPEIYQ